MRGSVQAGRRGVRPAAIVVLMLAAGGALLGGCDQPAPEPAPDGGPVCGVGFEEQADGACVDIDECAAPEACDWRTRCINLSGGYTCGSCPPGYDGDGQTGCMLPCPDGEHDGGDGRCVALDACSVGFEVDDEGECLPLDCGERAHHDGAGGCAPLGECAEGFAPDRVGDCAPAGCPAGTHDDGAGRCGPVDRCAPGFALDGDGACVALGCPDGDDAGEPDDVLDDARALAPDTSIEAVACPDDDDVFAVAPGSNCRVSAVLEARRGGDPAALSLTLLDGDGGLLARSDPATPEQPVLAEVAGPFYAVVDGDGVAYAIRVAVGDHDGGDGACVAEGECSPGWALDADGACTACAAGFHDGGDGACLPLGSCAAGFHDGGDGACLPLGSCAAGFHDGGDGACVALGLCAEGYALDADGDCAPPVGCEAGTRDDGTGQCVPDDAPCATGFGDDGAGGCAPPGVCAPGFALDYLDVCRALTPCMELVDDGRGVCRATCAGGYHSGGGEPALCLPLGDCQPGRVDRGDGRCAVGCEPPLVLTDSGVCVAPGICPEAAGGPDPVALSGGVVYPGVLCPGDVDAFEVDPPIGCSARFILRFDPADGALRLRVAVDGANADGVDSPDGQRLVVGPLDGPVSAQVGGADPATSAGYALRVDFDGHDGGDGTCYDFGACAPGYALAADDSGDCTACAPGFSRQGDRCLPDGECLPGQHDGGDGQCFDEGTCADGFHDGGDGRCLPIGRCAEGFQDGGAGDCVPAGSCSAGFTDDNGPLPGTACAPLGACARGRDGGDGQCVAGDACSPGFTDGGDGVCVPVGACSPGYEPFANVCFCVDGSRDGGDGICVEPDACSPGFRPGAPGSGCVAIGECDAGHHSAPWGACRPTARCPAGERDDGIGRCVGEGAGCAPGFDDRGGLCAAPPGCAAGYHDGGDGRCVALGECAPGFRGSANGCVPDGPCSPPSAPDDAPPLDPGPPVGGVVCGAPDVWRVDLPAGCGAELRLSADGAAGALDLEIYRGDGSLEAMAEGLGGRARLWLPPAESRSGYVQVVPYPADAVDPVPYRLALIVDPLRCAAECPPDLRPDGAGGCALPRAPCAPGWHDGGNDRCVPIDRCVDGFHDGGDGRCTAFDACRPGFHLTAGLTCTPTRVDCPAGERDDGAGRCSPACAAGLGYHDGGAGLCVAEPYCRAGYADDGGGTCIARAPGAMCAAVVPAPRPDPSGLCLTGACPDPADVSEDLGEAEPIQVGLGSPRTLQRSLCPGDLGDWYRVALAGTRLQARLGFHHGSNDMALRILTLDGAELARADSDTDDEVIGIPPTSGAVVVEVTGVGGGTPYRLDLVVTE